MMILQKNKGMSSYLEITGADLLYNYESPMLMNNTFKYIPVTTITEVDGDRSLNVKIDGLGTLMNKYGRLVPNITDIKKLVNDIRCCILELKEYLLNPDSLILNINYILFDGQCNEHKFIYIPGNKMCFREQIKELFEEIMRIFDHRDKKGVVFLYDLYSKFLEDSFTPEVFCKLPLVQNISDITQTENESYIETNDFMIEPPIIMDERESIEIDDKRTIDKSLYMLIILASIVVAVVLFIFFGIGSLKFSALMFIGASVYMIVDLLSAKKEQNNPSDESVEKPQIIEHIDNKALEIDTTVLTTHESVDYVSRLVPYKRTDVEEIYLIEGETKIGRQKNICDYCIADPSVSRVHAILSKNGKSVRVKDVGSTNGTYVNEKRLSKGEEQEAFLGDVVSIAGIQFECC